MEVSLMARLVVKNERGDELLNERVVCKTLGDERTSLQLLERMVRAIEEAEKEGVPYGGCVIDTTSTAVISASGVSSTSLGAVRRSRPHLEGLRARHRWAASP